MNCLTEAVLQRRFDGDLTAAEADVASAHLAACAACAAAAHRLADEMAMINSMFASADDAVTVPTERLQARLRAAIENDTTATAPCAPPPSSQLHRWREAWAAFFTVRPQIGWGLAGAALAAIICAILVAISIRNLDQRRLEDDEVALQFNAVGPVPLPPSQNVVSQRAKSDEATRAPVVLATHRPRAKVSRLNNSKSETMAVKLLPGEKSYLKAIVSLESNFQARGDLILRPEARVEYERNLAVVDQAIVTTRAAAMRNPYDTDANSMLLSAYQSKVELMSATMTSTENSFGGQ